MVWRIHRCFLVMPNSIPGWYDISGWSVEDIWVTSGNLAKDQWTHWVNIGDPMNGLKNPWHIFLVMPHSILGVLTYLGDLWNKSDKWVKINNFLGTPVLFYLAYLLTFYLAYLLTFYLAYLLISSDILSGISIWHIFWHSFWHIFWYLLAYLSDILSGISSDILSGISSDIFWHSFWHSITGDETAHNRS